MADQLLAYALLDRYNFLKLQHLAIHLGWQAEVLNVNLSDVIAATPTSTDDRLYELRRHTHDLADDLEFARGRREADRHHIHFVRRQ